jgi:hypothetical protein
MLHRPNSEEMKVRSKDETRDVLLKKSSSDFETAKSACNFICGLAIGS